MKNEYKSSLLKDNASSKAVYEKPAMQVYEIETEGAILQASSDGSRTTINDYIYGPELS